MGSSRRCPRGGRGKARRRGPGFEGFAPARGAEAPAVARLKSRKAELRAWRGEVVAGRLGKGEELGGRLDADRVQADIFGAGMTAARAIESGERAVRAAGQRLAEHVPLPVLWSPGAFLHGDILTQMRSEVKRYCGLRSGNGTAGSKASCDEMQAILKRALDATSEESPLPAWGQEPYDWSRDGKWIPYRSNDVMVAPTGRGGKAFPFLAPPFREGATRFSADGQWVIGLATQSDARWIGRAEEAERFERGQEATMTFSVSRVYFFDSETGRTLGAPAG